MLGMESWVASKFKHIDMVEENKLEVFVDGLDDISGPTFPTLFGTMDDRPLTLLPANASQPPWQSNGGM